MNTTDMTALAIAAGIVFAAYKFGPAPVRAGALAVASVMVAKRIPYVQNQLA